MGSSRAAAVPAEGDLLTPFYRQEPLFGVEVDLIAFQFILFLLHISCNLIGETVEVSIDTGVSGAGMINVECQPITTR